MLSSHLKTADIFNLINTMPSNLSLFLYSSAFAITCTGITYSLVPLYKILCQKTGITGSPQIQHIDSKKRFDLQDENLLRVKFVANKGKGMPWEFRPSQSQVSLHPGQTALAFYSAKNMANRELNGIATYNIVPARAALYFNKIQCFCFEEQRLGPKEEVEMPIFFYIDTDFNLDPLLRNTKEIILSYTLFEAK